MFLKPDRLARMLHDELYNRMLKFCKEVTPEFPAEKVVEMWLQRFYQNDGTIFIGVQLDKSGNIEAHCVVELNSAYGYKVIFCHQLEQDKPNIGYIDEGMEFLSKLKAESGAVFTICTVKRHTKALEKKYGFKIVRSVMIQHEGEEDDT